MNLCIPIIKDEGLQSRVNPHFGSAPMFMMVDPDTNTFTILENRNAHHQHGMCQPLNALAGHAVHGVVVGGIGLGALAKLRASSIHVYQSTHRTVQQTIEAFKEGSLQEVSPDTACVGHDHGRNGHGHGQGCGGQRGQGWGFGRPQQS